MEYIEGDTPDTQWPSLTYSQKQQITTTLKEYFNELRRLPSPGFYGSIGHRRLLDGMFWTLEPTPSINGPFDTEAALNEAMALKYTSASDPRTAHKANFYRRALARVFQCHEPNFTYADIQRKNVMIRRVGPDNADGPQYEVTLIDWEESGWYPSYWECSIAISTTRWDDDWDKWVVKILEPFDVKFPWLRMPYWDLWS